MVVGMPTRHGPGAGSASRVHDGMRNLDAGLRRQQASVIPTSPMECEARQLLEGDSPAEFNTDSPPNVRALKKGGRWAEGRAVYGVLSSHLAKHYQDAACNVQRSSQASQAQQRGANRHCTVLG